MISADVSAGTSRFRVLTGVVALSALLVAVLQGVFFGLNSPLTTYSVAAIVLATVNLLLAIRCLMTKDMRLLVVVLVLYIAQLSVFVAKPVITDPQLPFRLLQVAIILAYLASTMTGVLTAARMVSPVFAASLSFSLAAGLFIAEAILAPVHPVQPGSGPEVSALIREMTPHPSLGAVNAPQSTVTAYYRGNPQGNFQEADPRESQWWLRVAGGSVARVIFPGNDRDAERVEITRAATNVPYDISLNHSNLRARPNSQYAIGFRARSDRPRQIRVGFAKSHGDWSGLGLYAGVSLTPIWQNFGVEFIVSVRPTHLFPRGRS